MIVKELIETLKRFPPESTVLLTVSSGFPGWNDSNACFSCVEKFLDAARKRPPTEKPREGEKVLGKTKYGDVFFLEYSGGCWWDGNSGDLAEPFYDEDIDWWLPLGRLIGEKT